MPYHVHFIDDDPVLVYGPYSLKSAKDFARIGSQHGGRRAVAELVDGAWRVVRVYARGDRIWPLLEEQLEHLTKAEHPRTLTVRPRKRVAKLAANPETGIQGSITPEGGSLYVRLSPNALAVLDTSAIEGLGLYINRLLVPEHFRGKKTGAQLLNELKRQARAAGHTRLLVQPGGYDLDRQDDRVRFYERQGFRFEPELESYVFNLPVEIHMNPSQTPAEIKQIVEAALVKQFDVSRKLAQRSVWTAESDLKRRLGWTSGEPGDAVVLICTEHGLPMWGYSGPEVDKGWEAVDRAVGPDYYIDLLNDAVYGVYPVRGAEPVPLPRKNPEEHPLTAAWRAWASTGVVEKRRLLVQVINASRLAYRWQSFDKALENLHFMGASPEEATESLAQAKELCMRLGWSASALRKDFA